MPTIMVVDDSPMDRRLIGGFLEKEEGYQVEYASGGDEALEQMRGNPPQLVLTDLIMPGMDGLQLVAAVVEQYPLTPVVLVTGKGSEETAVKALEAGASSYVPKGLLNKLLLETVDKVLAVASEKQTHAQLMDSVIANEWWFQIGNDSSLIAPLVNHLNGWAQLLGLCDEATGIRVAVALEEALNNALYHGNLELSSSAREGGIRAYRKLVDERLQTPPYRDRRVFVKAKLSRNDAVFTVRDEGRGFDPSSLPDPRQPVNLERASGRGLLLMRTFMDELRFNDLGNEVTMVKRAVRRD